MKTKITSFSMMVMVLGFCLMPIGCKDGLLSPENQTQSPELEESSSQGFWNGTVNKPFIADFFTSGGVQPGPASEEICGSPPLFYNVQEGYGEATHLGRFKIRITFCVDATDLGDGILSPGESIPYFSNEKTEGYLLAANGDKIYILIEEGEIIPTDVPGYEYEFKDPFLFTGGTGRFEGVSGSGVTNSLVTFEPVERTDHKWSGILQFPKGR